MEREVLDHLRRFRAFVLTTHEPLDGDGVGSELSLRRVLRSFGSEVHVVNPGPTPQPFLFLPDIEVAHTFPDGMPSAVDAVVTLDCGGRERIARILDAVRGRAFVINIDHHAGNEAFGDVNWFDSKSAATGQMIYRLAREADVEIDGAMALQLYTALVSDTGRFSYSNTTPECHDIAAHLLRCGVRPSLVLKHLYREKPLSLVKIEGMAAAELRFAAGGLIAWTRVTSEMCRKAGLTQLEARDLIDIPASVAGVNVAVLFREMQLGVLTKVSFRSSAGVDVNRFAARFGGGGHPRAAGCQIAKSLADAEALVMPELERTVAETSAPGAPLDE